MTAQKGKDLLLKVDDAAGKAGKSARQK